MAAETASLPFAEQIRFFRQKLALGTRAWTDIWQSQHDTAFVVAGAMKRDLLTDLRRAVDRAISEGVTLAQFRQDFDDIVARNGWSYRGGRNWRTRVIYETNLRQSYNAGRYEQMKAVSDRRPYWRYRHNDSVQNPRPQHLAWDGLILRHDDAWWDTHSPQNGWGCQCYIETLSERDMRRLGKSGPDEAPPIEWREETVGVRGPSPRVVRVPAGLDPGFAYQPGRYRNEGLAPPPLDRDELLPGTGAPATDALPAPRPAPANRLLPAGLPDAEYLAAFLAEFGVPEGERQAFIEDVAGEMLLVSDALFRERRGELKIDKRGRAPYLLLYADAIRLPDEIWESWAEHEGRAYLRRRYIARFLIEGEDVPTVAVFETGTLGWVGVTAHRTDTVRQLVQRSRIGQRVYRREG